MADDRIQTAIEFAIQTDGFKVLHGKKKEIVGTAYWCQVKQ